MALKPSMAFCILLLALALIAAGCTGQIQREATLPEAEYGDDTSASASTATTVTVERTDPEIEQLSEELSDIETLDSDLDAENLDALERDLDNINW